MDGGNFREELYVYGSFSEYDNIASNLPNLILSSPMVASLRKIHKGVDEENMFNLSWRGEGPADGNIVRYVFVDFSRKIGSGDLDDLSDEMYGCVLRAVEGLEDIDYFSYLSQLPQ